MKNNDGNYFQKTRAGNYYPDKISDWKWEGIEFFISKVVGAVKSDATIAEMFPSDWHFIVTHKDTGYCIPDINSSTITDAKICAEVSLEKVGYEKFLEILAQSSGVEV